jgi:hypothetical protein
MVSGYACHMLMAYLNSMLKVGWSYLYFISNQVLIKFDQLKLLNAVNLSALFCLSLCIHSFPHTC